jgi:ATP-dependent RNA helicase DDX31/DBP7
VPRKEWNNPGQTSSSKNAKFSSLFKNNHEIPKVGDLKVDGVKESLFSENKFSRLNLSAYLTDCLEKRFSLKKMTQIQEKTIPAIMGGKDCYVKSQTGSGKTLAYAIPIVQALQAQVPKMKRTDGIKALVLVPTRELAQQTCQVFEQLCNVSHWGCYLAINILSLIFTI